MTARIHWLGAGLSSVPGIKELARNKQALIVWNRSLEKALLALKGCELDVRALTWDALDGAVESGDVVVSMLPATLHPEVAELCLRKGAHFVSSSYISPEMQALHAKAKDAGLSFVNEVGLDPGLDHLLAHLLVDAYTASEVFAPDNQHYFRSYCGGFPSVANDFKYKFSWSPLGVLKALRSSAQWREHGEVRTSKAPWEALSRYHASLPGGGSETFESYPNRDSLPFMAQYQFGADWDVQEFVRGTLRLDGWSTAWQGLFDEIGGLSGPQGDARLSEISAELERNYSYEANEADRVVMCVELEVKREGRTVWHQSYQIDAHGNDKGQAMARLVSYPVGLAIESVLAGELPAGVSAAPHCPKQIHAWLERLTLLGESLGHADHLA
ncbi:saccharopine dehydrogenase family protein [Pseudoalteromonas sp. T1lg75]|uniref:saccharopine dehydrogenase family protein n=1 Tax=Pseudoalteromonas sp. T1lg75 TaxID=2077102 RepID=UPI000CF6C386|nr:saccharopine dehydrogenase family protein [Pseudoalteromonas sp. T1lg75]